MKKKGWMILWILIIALLTLLLPIPEVNAREGPFTEGPYTYWVNEDDSVMISQYIGLDDELVIPSELGGLPVSMIAAGAFQSRGLQAVRIPEGIKNIVQFAFAENQLAFVSIPESVDNLGWRAFSNNNLTEVVIHNAEVTFEADVFAGNDSNLTLIGYAGSTTEAYAYANGYPFMDIDHYLGYSFLFDDNGDGTATITGWNDRGFGPAPESLFIPAELEVPGESIRLIVTGIGSMAFQMRSLTDVTIPDSVTMIKAGAFSNNNLTEVVIHNAEVTFERYAFMGNDPNLTLIGYAGSTAETYADANRYRFVSIVSEGFDYIDHEDGTATIIGWNEAVYGTMPDPLVIPAELGGLTVTGIGSHAFSRKSLTGVTIPDSVTTIGNAAFADNALEEVVLSANMREIGAEAFRDNEMSTVMIPAGVRVLGAGAFQNNRLSSVVLPATMTEIAARAFMDNQLVEVKLPDDLEKIGDEAFRNNRLAAVELPLGVTKVGARAFERNQLADILLPDSVTEIGSSAFAINELADIMLPDSVTEIGSAAFADNGLTSVELPSYITEIKASVFSRNRLATVTIPDNVTAIGSQAFAFNKLEEVMISANVTDIADSVFWRNNLTQVIVHNDEVAFGNNVFRDNDADLTLIGYTGSTTEAYASAYSYKFRSIVHYLGLGFTYDDNGDGTVTITGWDEREYGSVPDLMVIPSEIDGLTVTAIGDDSFTRKRISELILPNGITTIGESAFLENQLNTLELPASVTTIGGWAFQSNSLSELKIPDSVVDLGNYTFGYNNLVSVELPDSLSTIGAGVFAENNLAELTIPDSVTSIGRWAFAGNNLTKVELGASVSTIGERAFSENDLESVFFPASVTDLGEHSFYRNKLERIEFASGSRLLRIRIEAFRNNNLESLVLPHGVQTISAWAFEDNNLKEVVIPDTVTQIHTATFRNNQLTKVVIPGSVETIGEEAFYHNKLVEAVIHRDDATFGDDAFSHNDPGLTLIGHAASTAEDHAAEKGFRFVSFDSSPHVTILHDETVVAGSIEAEVGTSTALAIEYAHSHFAMESVEWTVDGASAGSADTLLLDISNTGEKTVQVTVTTEYGGTATATVTVTGVHMVASVGELDDIRVTTGTDRSDISLPGEAEVTLGNGEKLELGVTWDNGDPVYDGGTVGTYTFTGELTLPGDVRNPHERKATVDVHVVRTAPTISFGSNGNEDWSANASTTVTVTGTDFDVDDDSLRYVWTQDEVPPADDAEGWTSFDKGDTLTLGGKDGDWYLHVLARDVRGNVAVARTERFRLDNSVPDISVELRHEDGSSYASGTWTNRQVTAVIEATDAHSGVALIEYSTDGGTSWHTYAAEPIAFMTEGAHTLRVRAADVAGNSGEAALQQINISRGGLTLDVSLTFSDDGSPYTSDTWTRHSVTAEVYASQATEGVVVTSVTYSTDGGGAWQPYAEPIAFAAEGAHTLAVQATDSAGNEVRLAYHIRIDHTAPSISFAANGSDSEARSASTRVEVSDDASGVEDSSLRYVWTQDEVPPAYDAAEWAFFSSGDTLTLDGVDGDWYLHVQAADAVGNMSRATTNRFRLTSIGGSPGGGSGGGGSSGTSSEPAQPDNTWMVGTEGEVILFDGGRIIIPEEAWHRVFYVTIEESASDALSFTEQDRLASKAIAITKDQEGNFTEDVTIVLYVSMDGLTEESWAISLYRFDEETTEWIELDNIEVDWAQAAVSGTVDHFTTVATTYAAIARPVDADAPPLEAPLFSDVAGHWAEEDIRRLSAQDVVNGYPDGTFRPNHDMTRAEFVTMVVQALNLEPSAGSGYAFADSAHHWAREAIATAAASGIVTGYDEMTFGVNDPITREQMALMIVRALQLETGAGGTSAFADQHAISEWAREAVAVLQAEGMMDGYPDGSFRPQQKVTRAEAVAVLARGFAWLHANR
ncbi:leucine-rich repeat protein [Xylanibacillus composti]|uniref:SLH domain-containing protein n=1 Tax=Xylanibacillus composti TaxID=1572762 RepID=A0A8J4M457_9BACL|nr:leucine-rich repeat protein [Xylanibacillus composti]GIQ70792.1 hypothetical protein XYCOK13_36160 [Xylanibacillus composti]